jgi:hypothetical protein
MLYFAMDPQERSDEVLAQFDIHHDANENLLICNRPECGFALSVARCQLTSHLLTRHLNQAYPHGFSDPTQAEPQADGSLIYPHLRQLNGFACRSCVYRTVNFQSIRRHVSKVYLCGRSATQANFRDTFDHVVLQTWTYSTSGGDQWY